MTEKIKMSTESYKGVRDFYPEDMAVQNYIFDTWKKVCKENGFVEYSASPLEPLELYKAKSGSEIVDEQTFTFKDRGDRDVALRPEMTPTLARMVAAQRRSLKFPLRWFSIPNLFRYEKPQKGRRREHYQLNCDILGIAGVEAEVEIVSLVHKIMLAFGAKPTDFVIKINDRKIMFEIYKPILKDENEWPEVCRFLDKRSKLNPEEQKESEEKYFSRPFSKEEAEEKYKNTELAKLITELKDKGVNAELDSTIMRGFDYYTGMVFEVYDNSEENKRALLGGGRYDNLLEIFGVEPVPTVGFGMGDVTIRDFLETHNLPLCAK